MKLLGWMHRRLSQTGSGGGYPFSDFKTCNDQWKVYTDAQNKDEDPPMIYIGEDDSFFHSLLNIGTLGHITEGGEATNFLTAPPPSVDYYIMAKEEEEEEEEEEDNESAADHATKLELVPLNPAVEKSLVVTTSQPKIPVIDRKLVVNYQRQTLYDLFLQSDLKGNMIDNNNNNNNNKIKKVKSNSIGVQSLVKKLVPKCHGSGLKHSSATEDDCILNGDGGTGTSSKKLHKMIKIFHKKIHPDQNPGRTSAKNKVAVKSEKNRHPAKTPSEVITTLPSSDSTENCTECHDDNRARWIKTDSEFLVLEL